MLKQPTNGLLNKEAGSRGGLTITGTTTIRISESSAKWLKKVGHSGGCICPPVMVGTQVISVAGVRSLARCCDLAADKAWESREYPITALNALRFLARLAIQAEKAREVGGQNSYVIAQKVTLRYTDWSSSFLTEPIHRIVEDRVAATTQPDHRLVRYIAWAVTHDQTAQYREFGRLLTTDPEDNKLAIRLAQKIVRSAIAARTRYRQSRST